jgi:hypothetical protein
MLYPKKMTPGMLLLKYMVLSLYVIFPVITFFCGIQYQKKLTPDISISPNPIIPTIISPTASGKLPTPTEKKITIQGSVDLFELPPEFIADAPFTLHVLDKNGVLYDILLPSGESACPFVPERNDVLGKLKKGDYVEIYGRASTNESIRICFADEYLKLLDTEP